MEPDELEKLKARIPDLLSGMLDENEARDLQNRISQDPQARQEFELYKLSWDRLKDWKDEEPDRGYVSRFWKRVADEEPAPQNFRERVLALWSSRQLAPIYAAVSLILVIGFYMLRSIPGSDSLPQVAALNDEDLEFVESIDLVENLGVLEDWELLDDMEIIESLDNGAA